MPQTLCMFKVRAVAWRSVIFEAITTRQMKIPLQCYDAVGDFLRVSWRLALSKVLAGSPRGRSSGVTEVLHSNLSEFLSDIQKQLSKWLNPK